MGRTWYVHRENKYGPFDDSQMAAMVRSGRVTPTDFVWTQGMQSWTRLADTDLVAQDSEPRNPFDFTGGGRRANQPRQAAPADPFDFTSPRAQRHGSATKRLVRPAHRHRSAALGLARGRWIFLSVVLLAGYLGILGYYQVQIDREDEASCEIGYASVGVSTASDRLGISSNRQSLDEAQVAFGRSLNAQMEYEKLIEHGFAKARRNRALVVWSGIWGVLAIAYFLTVVNKTKNQKIKRR